MFSKMYKVVLGALMVAALLVSCADVPATGPELKDQRSLYRFINAAPELATVNISVDGAALGATAFGAATGYSDLPAGSRRVALSSSAGDTARVAMDSEQKGTIIVLPKTGAVREFFNVRERKVYFPAVADTATTGQVVFVSASTDTLNIAVNGPTPLVGTGILIRSTSGYLSLKPGSYTVDVKKGTTTLSSLALTVTLKKRNTVVFMGSGATAVAKQFADD